MHFGQVAAIGGTVILVVVLGLSLAAHYGSSDSSEGGGSFMLYGSTGSNTTIRVTSNYAGSLAGTGDSDYLLKFEMREYDEVSETFKVTFFNGADKAYVFTHWPNAAGKLELLDCWSGGFTSDDLKFDTPLKSPMLMETLFGDDGMPIFFGGYHVEDFSLGKFNDTVFTDGIVDFEGADDECARRAERKLEVSDDASEQHRRLESWTAAHETEAAENCKWYQALFDTQALANVEDDGVDREGYDGESSTCSGGAGKCCKKRYANTGGNWIVGDPGHDELLTCKAPSNEFDTLQLWGTNSDNDIMNDISITSTSFSGGVHSGVNNEANDVMSSISPSQMGSDVIVTGFSLGGATAHQVASRLKHDHNKNVLLITGGEFASMEDSDSRAVHGEHYRVIAEQWQHDWTISCFWDVVPGLGFTWEHPSGSHPMYIRKTTHADTCTTQCTCRNQNTVHWKCAWCGRSDCAMPCSCSNAGESRELTGNGGCAHIGQCRSSCNTVCTPNPPTYTVSAHRCDHGYSSLNPIVNSFTAWTSSMSMMAGAYSEPGMIDGHTFNYKKFVGKGLCGVGGAGAAAVYSTSAIDNMGDAGSAGCQDDPAYTGYAGISFYGCNFWENYGYCANGAPRYGWVNNYKQDGYNRGNLGPVDACCACGGGL